MIKEKQEGIISQLISYTWIYEKIFGFLLKPLVLNKSLEDKKNILIKVFGFIDIEDIFESEVDKKEFRKNSEIIFRFAKNDEEKKWLSKIFN